MNNLRIKKVVEFLYSSNNSQDVPLRISVTFGMGGDDLTKEELAELLVILSNSINLKEDLLVFRQKLG